jgi:mevalonate kinase
MTRGEIMSIAFAPGKAILFGEHAVVYGRPAIAVPIAKVRAQATVTPGARGSGLVVVATDLHRTYNVSDVPPDDPLRAIALNTLTHLGVPRPLDLVIEISSTIPIACGLGSGTAVSAAVARALAAYFDVVLPNAVLSDLVFEVEKIHHGRPSGIDNTVVTYQQPVYFVRGQTIETLRVASPFLLIVGDTGVCSPTRVAVNDVCEGRNCDPELYERLFDGIGAIADHARRTIESGEVERLGGWMDENQLLLQQLGVSSPELDRLVTAAKRAGAEGAKLSGAGRGGNMIALVSADTARDVEAALRAAGACRVIVTEVC